MIGLENQFDHYCRLSGPVVVALDFNLDVGSFRKCCCFGTQTSFLTPSVWLLILFLPQGMSVAPSWRDHATHIQKASSIRPFAVVGVVTFLVFLFSREPRPWLQKYFTVSALSSLENKNKTGLIYPGAPSGIGLRRLPMRFLKSNHECR